MGKTANDFFAQMASLSEDGWLDMRKTMYAARRGVMGSVFSDAQKRWHVNERKPAYEYPLALAHYKQHGGAFRQARIQEKVFPTKGGSREVAAALTKLVNHWSLRGHLLQAHAAVYDSAWIDGLGVYESFRNQLTDDPFGETMTVAGNAIQHMFDLTSPMPDGSTIMNAMKQSWVNRPELARMFPFRELDDPEYFDSLLMSGAPTTAMRGGFDDIVNQLSGDETRHHDFTPEQITGVSRTGRIPVVEWYHRSIVPILSLYNFVTQQQVDVTNESESNVAQMLLHLRNTGQPAVVIRRPGVKLYLSVLINNTDVVYDSQPVKPNVLPYTYCFGYKFGQMLIGEAQGMLDASLSFAKTMSATSDVIAKSANLGLITKGHIDKAADASTVQKLEDVASGRGGHVNLPAGVDIDVVRQDTQNVQGMLAYAGQMTELMKFTTSSPDNVRGIGEGSHQSGVHAQQMIAQAMMGSEILRSNSQHARRILTGTVIKMIQEWDGPIPYRMMHYIDEGEQDQEAIIFNQYVADQIINNVGVGSYTNTVDFTAYSVTDRRSRVRELYDAAAASGQPIPFDLMVEMSDLPDSDIYVKKYRIGQQALQRQQLVEAIRSTAGNR